VRNRSVAWPYRYTLGALSVACEAVLPGRVSGRDYYNPYTATVHVYSDVPALAIKQASHSKDFTRRTYPGTYSLATIVPVINLWPEAIAPGDALAYADRPGHGSSLQPPSLRLERLRPVPEGPQYRSINRPHIRHRKPSLEKRCRSGRFQPATLKQTQRPQHEGQNASDAIRVDFGNCTGSYLKEQRVAALNNRGFFGKCTHHIELRSREPADTTRRSQKRQRVR